MLTPPFFNPLCKQVAFRTSLQQDIKRRQIYLSMGNVHYWLYEFQGRIKWVLTTVSYIIYLPLVNFFVIFSFFHDKNYFYKRCWQIRVRKVPWLLSDKRNSVIFFLNMWTFIFCITENIMETVTNDPGWWVIVQTGPVFNIYLNFYLNSLWQLCQIERYLLEEELKAISSFDCSWHFKGSTVYKLNVVWSSYCFVPGNVTVCLVSIILSFELLILKWFSSRVLLHIHF